MIIDPLKVFLKDWALVTARKDGKFNTMTIGWGELGTLWNKDVITVYVKPCRYTYEFMEADDYFTVSFFDEAYRKDLSYLGSHSGKDEDKLARTKLNAYAIENGIAYKEAKLTILAKKIYHADLCLDNIPKEMIERYYQSEAVHRLYTGEIIKIYE